MATLDDKLLGEKLQYYCSSSEDEGPRGDDDTGADERVSRRQRASVRPLSSVSNRSIPSSRYDVRQSTNTGPKGVLRDYQRQQQAEARRLLHGTVGKQEQNPDVALADLDEELSAAADQALQQILDDRREHAQNQQNGSHQRFDGVISLRNGEEMLKAIDKEHAQVTVLILIHEGQFSGAKPFVSGLSRVSHAFPAIKCCEIAADLLADTLTSEFRQRALPTLQVYRGGNLCGNFLRLADDCKFADYGDSSVADLEDFLNEKGILDNLEPNSSEK